MTILPFADALTPSNDTEYDRRKWLYVPDCYSDYRYILGVKGSRPLICVGINPSTAAPDALDNTLKSVSRIAASNGYDGWMMFNVYAQRATRPQDMDLELNKVLHCENMKAFRWLLELAGNKPTIWAAWGTVIERRPYLARCVKDLAEIAESYGAVWCCAGSRSKAGHPHHPLYLRKDSSLTEFEIGKYLESIEAK